MRGNLRWRQIRPIHPNFRNELLTCEYCHDDATHYQLIPAKILWCDYHVKEVRKWRRKQIPSAAKARMATKRQEEEFEELRRPSIIRAMND